MVTYTVHWQEWGVSMTFGKQTDQIILCTILPLEDVSATKDLRPIELKVSKGCCSRLDSSDRSVAVRCVSWRYVVLSCTPSTSLPRLASQVRRSACPNGSGRMLGRIMWHVRLQVLWQVTGIAHILRCIPDVSRFRQNTSVIRHLHCPVIHKAQRSTIDTRLLV